MSIKSRLEKLEQIDSGLCPLHPLMVFYGNDGSREDEMDEEPSATCPCGKPSVVLNVVYGDWQTEAAA